MLDPLIHITCSDGEDPRFVCLFFILWRKIISKKKKCILFLKKIFCSPNNTNVGYPYVFDACQGNLKCDARFVSAKESFLKKTKKKKGSVPTSQLRYVDSVVTVVNRPPHCLDKITRVWFAYDVCGNVSNATQIIYATRDCSPCGTVIPCK